MGLLSNGLLPHHTHQLLELVPSSGQSHLNHHLYLEKFSNKSRRKKSKAPTQIPLRRRMVLAFRPEGRLSGASAERDDGGVSMVVGLHGAPTRSCTVSGKRPLEGPQEARGCPGARPGVSCLQAIGQQRCPACKPPWRPRCCLYPRPRGPSVSSVTWCSFPPSAPRRGVMAFSHFSRPSPPPGFQDGRSFSIPV